MRFMHLCDICIGNCNESGMPWAEDREEELADSLRNLLARAEDEGVGLVLISGGLFAHIPTEAELITAGNIFRSHPDIEIVITAGERDKITESSPVKSFEWPDNVHYVLSNKPERIVIKRLSAEVFAASSVSLIKAEQNIKSIKEEMPILPYKDLPDAVEGDELIISEEDMDADPEELIAFSESFEDREHIRLCMLSFSGRSDTLKRIFNGSDLSYIAIGGKKREKELLKNRMYYPGTFEPFCMDETGEHGAFTGYISEESGLVESMSLLPLASISYVTLNIKLTPKTTQRELTESLKKELVRRGEKNIYRLRLTGSRDPEEELGLSELKEEFRINEIIDESVPEYDLAGLFKAHSQDMIGFYISSIMADKHEMSGIEKKAMFHGIEALLKSSAV